MWTRQTKRCGVALNNDVHNIQMVNSVMRLKLSGLRVHVVVLISIIWRLMRIQFLSFLVLAVASAHVVVSKTHTRLKRTLCNWTKQDKTCKFSRKSSFSSYVQHKNRNLHVWSCFVRLKSVLCNLLCVLDLFQNAGSQFCFRFSCRYVCLSRAVITPFACGLLCQATQLFPRT